MKKNKETMNKSNTALNDGKVNTTESKATMNKSKVNTSDTRTAKNKSRFYVSYKKTFCFVKPYIAEIVISILSLVAGSACFLVLPYLLKILIDDILVKGNISNLYIFCLCTLGVVVLGNCLNFLARYLFANFSEKIAIDARKNLFTRLIHYELSFFQHHQLGDLVSRLRDDSSMVHSLFTFVIATLVTNFFNLIFVFVILFKMNVKLSIIVLISIPVYICINNYFSKILRINAHKTMAERGRLMTFIYDIFSKVLVIKNFVQEKAQITKLVTISNNLKVLAVKGEVSGYMASSMTQLTTQFVGVLVLFLGGLDAIHGHFSPGSLIAFYTYLGNLFGPILTLTQSNIQINQIIASVERYFEYLDNPPRVEELNAGYPLEQVAGHISFDHVSFGYGTETVLADITLDIAPQEKIALLGKSGIGKTTMALLLKRFFEPTEGQILLDGQNIQNIPLEQLRKHIGYLTQDPYIINGTIRNNILLGAHTEVTDQQIWAALELAELKEFILDLPEQLDTVLENNGARLSGGQKQRLSIARILLSNPEIVVFDEAFSHLDIETEQRIWENFKVWLQDKTTIFITHKLWDPDYFNRLVLINRSIQSMGHFSELKGNAFLDQILEGSASRVS